MTLKFSTAAPLAASLVIQPGTTVEQEEDGKMNMASRGISQRPGDQTSPPPAGGWPIWFHPSGFERVEAGKEIKP